MHCNPRQPLTCLLIVLPVSLLFLVNIEAEAHDSSSLLPEVSTKEIKNNMRIMLTKMKLRNVPLAKAVNEQNLADLYVEERELKKEVAEIEKSMNLASGISSRLPNNGPGEVHEQMDDMARAKIMQLGKYKTDELERKRARLAKVRAQIADSRALIKHPENFIKVPENFVEDNEAQRQLERDLLMKDRENALFRYQVNANQIPAPAWLLDHW